MNIAAAFEELNHLKYFKLNENPFPVAPDNRNFFISEHIDQILFEIVHGIISRKGFLVLTGEIGLGKTTISRRIMSILEEKGIETSLVFYSVFRDVELLREINRDFGIQKNNLVFGDQMKCLSDFLLSCNKDGKNCTIIIDDAQNLSYKSLELVRLISNLEADQQKLVQILLVGQPELMQKLKKRELRQLESRIIIKKEVKQLNRSELEDYLLFKLNRSANGASVGIKRSAVSKIHKFSNGNFRKVNKLMDRCLYFAYYYDNQNITARIVKEAIFDLEPEREQSGRLNRFFSLPVTVTALFISIMLFLNAFPLFKFNNEKHTSIYKREKNKSVNHFSENRVSKLSSGAVPVNIVQESTVPTPIHSFLNSYGLLQYDHELYRGLTLGRLNKIKREIYAQTGYQLITLKNIPDFVRKKYGILSYPSSSGHEKLNYLFWKPSLRIDRFYYTYRGREIKILQKKLAGFSIYRYRLDGIVGKKLMKAVIKFQRKMNLNVTGYPDEQTVFLLYNFRRIRTES